MKQLRGSGLTPSERGMLLAILSYANKDGTNAHPGHEKLAADLGISVRYVGILIKSLRAKGFLLQTRPGRRGPDGDVPACYTVTRPTGIIVPKDLSEQLCAKPQDSIGTIVLPTVGTRRTGGRRRPASEASVVTKDPWVTPGSPAAPGSGSGIAVGGGRLAGDVAGSDQGSADVSNANENDPPPQDPWGPAPTPARRDREHRYDLDEEFA